MSQALCEKLVLDVVSILGEPAFDLASAFCVKAPKCEALQTRIQMSERLQRREESLGLGKSGRFYRNVVVFWAEHLRMSGTFQAGKHFDKDVKVEMCQDSFSGWQVASYFELLGIVC